MATNNYKASDLASLFLYRTKNQVVYYDFITKNAFVISNSNAKGFLTHQARIPTATATAIAIAFISKQEIIGAIIGIIVFGVWEYFFRKHYLYNLPVDVDFIKPQRNNFLYNAAREYSFLRLILSTLGMAFFALIIYSTLVYGGYAGLYYMVNVCACVLCALVALFFLVCLVIKFINRD